jgi:hypothetical protein
MDRDRGFGRPSHGSQPGGAPAAHEGLGVLGGTSILGGHGSYLGTVAGAILITQLHRRHAVAV